MFNSPSRRIYLGRLPSTFQRADVEKHLSSYGTIVECKVMNGFGFVEFSKLQEAEDVVETFSRQSFLGEHVVIEFAKPSRYAKEASSSQLSPDAKIPPVHAQLRYCVWVFNLSQWTRWQDLKDFGRTGGATVAYSDIDSLDPTLGFIEYLSSEDAKRAVTLLDKTDLRGNIVRVRTQQQVNRDRASQRARSRSRSPSGHHRNQRKEYTHRGRNEYAWSESKSNDEEGQRRGWKYDKGPAWWLHDTARQQD